MLHAVTLKVAFCVLTVDLLKFKDMLTHWHVVHHVSYGSQDVSVDSKRLIGQHSRLAS